MKYNDKHITTLSGLDPIMRSPEMYINCPVEEPRAHLQILKEVIDNSVDEARLAKPNPVNVNIQFYISADKKYQVRVMDNGRGIPLNKVADAFTKMHTSGKFFGDSYVSSIGTHGLGVKILTALASRVIVMSSREKKLTVLKIKNATVESLEIVDRPDVDDIPPHGTLVYYELSSKYFNMSQYTKMMSLVIPFINFINAMNDNLNITVSESSNLLTNKSLKSDVPALSKLLFGVSERWVYNKPNYSRVDYLVDEFGIDPTPLFVFPTIKHDGSLLDYDIESNVFIPNTLCNGVKIAGSINGTPIHVPSSSHILAVTSRIKHYLSHSITNPSLKMFVDSKYYKLPITGIVQGIVAPDKLKFVGQSKSEYRSAEFIRTVTPVIDNTLNGISRDEWDWLYMRLEDSIREQYHSYSRKSVTRSNGLSEINLDLSKPKSYSPCRSLDRNVIELLIAEGESASGQVERCRDANTQAVFQIRGKFTNLLRATGEVSNEILDDLITLIGLVPTDTDLSNLNFNTIGILTDADADGYHISCLLLTAFYKINPLLLERGKVFVANPPLYEFCFGDKCSIWLRDITALRDVRIQNLYKPTIGIKLVNEYTKSYVVLKGDAYNDFIYAVLNLADVINLCADSLVMSPKLLENIVMSWEYLKNKDWAGMKMKMGVADIRYSEEYRTLLIIHGDNDIQVQLDDLDTEISRYILPELRKFNFNAVDCMITSKMTDVYDNTPVSVMELYDILKVLDSVCITDRLKGLGEMSPEGLAYTCVDPNTRMVTYIKSVGELELVYKLMGVDTTYRKKLVMENGEI